MLHHGPGTVPSVSLLSSALKQTLEIVATGMEHVYKDQQATLGFTANGFTPRQIESFLRKALDAGAKHEPTVETGNKYGVSKHFHKINSDLIMASFEQSNLCKALAPAKKQRALNTLGVIFQDKEMRNRNILHSGMLDSAVIGNLLNFPKSLFGFPYGGHGTDGNEVLSLCLFSYRQMWWKTTSASNPASTDSRVSNIRPLVVYVRGSNDTDAVVSNLKSCAHRIAMDFQVTTRSKLAADTQHHLSKIAVILTSFDDDMIQFVSKFSDQNKLSYHIHVMDTEFRSVFATHSAPVHFELPTAVQSLTIEEGLLTSGYSIYRNVSLRDLHLDVGYDWQAAYMSPNEGGSGASTPLFADFCTIMLGWTTLHEVCSQENGGWCTPDDRLLLPTCVPPESDLIMTESKGMTNLKTFLKIDEAISWGKEYIADSNSSSNSNSSSSSENSKSSSESNSDRQRKRANMERLLVRFQRAFIGGANRSLEVLTSGGGTRSINFAFEAVLEKDRKFWLDAGGQQPTTSRRRRVLTGNPHLAVERAERRFNFELVRLPVDGALSPIKLAKHVQDPSVIAVYTQTLSYTDGITDPLQEILNIIEIENQRRSKLGMSPVTLINDCCLAFSVLCHAPETRILDLSAMTMETTHKHIRHWSDMKTPIMVTIDAHKHLGCDKGVSTVIGTPGTLSVLSGRVRVGAQPTTDTLVRALASMRVVGTDKYFEQYLDLGRNVKRVVDTVEKIGLTLVHAKYRSNGSTVVSVEDPSGLMKSRMKKRGHVLAALFNLYPEDLTRCQSGWQLSMTPQCLREVDGRCALDIFLEDLVKEQQCMQESSTYKLIQQLPVQENSLVACLVGGNLDPFLLPLLEKVGFGRTFTTRFIRRFFTAQMDCGVLNTNKRKNPASLVVRRGALATIVMLVLLVLRRRMFRR